MFWCKLVNFKESPVRKILESEIFNESYQKVE